MRRGLLRGKIQDFRRVRSQEDVDEGKEEAKTSEDRNCYAGILKVFLSRFESPLGRAHSDEEGHPIERKKKHAQGSEEQKENERRRLTLARHHKASSTTREPSAESPEQEVSWSLHHRTRNETALRRKEGRELNVALEKEARRASEGESLLRQRLSRH